MTHMKGQRVNVMNILGSMSCEQEQLHDIECCEKRYGTPKYLSIAVFM